MSVEAEVIDLLRPVLLSVDHSLQGNALRTHLALVCPLGIVET